MLSALLAGALAARGALAWGAIGHETVGYIATAFLGTKTQDFVNTYLDKSYNGSLGPAGPWADDVKYSSAYSWSEDWHYIDAEDSPLNGSCSVVPSRDCGDTGCLLSAITNYTSRIQDSSLDDKQRDEALKFLVHFFGDITQPLHCEAYKVGGNDIDVKYNGDDTELHAVWDTAMIETLVNGTYGSSITKFADALVTEIKTGKYESVKDDWIKCDDPSLGGRMLARQFDPRSPSIDRDVLRAHAHALDALASEYPGFLTCPAEWASDSNSYDCSTVFKGYTVDDLYPTYYNANIDIVQLQLAKGGYRLATWLNEIFDGSST